MPDTNARREGGKQTCWLGELDELLDRQ